MDDRLLNSRSPEEMSDGSLTKLTTARMMGEGTSMTPSRTMPMSGHLSETMEYSESSMRPNEIGFKVTGSHSAPVVETVMSPPSNIAGSSSLGPPPSVNTLTKGRPSFKKKRFETSSGPMDRPGSLGTGGRQESSWVGGEETRHILEKRKLQDLLHQIDPREKMESDVEQVLLEMADEFIENVAQFACMIAKHRKAATLEVKDAQLHLERNWNIRVSGFGADEVRGPKKASISDAHKQRIALVKKLMHPNQMRK